MRALSLLRRTSARNINIASWHSPHSLTWSWILSLSWNTPAYVKPHAQWASVGPHRFRGFSVGNLVNAHARRDNNGWQLGVSLLGLGLNWHRQRPMWFRDLYWKRENEHSGYRRAA